MADKTKEMTHEERTEAIKQLVEAVRPLFAHYEEGSIPGAALGELTAIWLASHVVDDDPEATIKFRVELLRKQVRYVLAMTDVIDIELETFVSNTTKGH